MFYSYGSVLSPLRQSLTQDNLCAHCAVLIFFDIMMIFSLLVAQCNVFSLYFEVLSVNTTVTTGRGMWGIWG